MSAKPCPFVWYELMTSDAPAAEAFYRDVVGWQLQDAGMPGMRYTLLQVAGNGIAGLMALPAEAAAAGARPGWMGYVAVDDVDAMAQRLVQAGGSLHRPPEDIPGVGRFAVVADPHGAGFMLFKGQDDEAPPAPQAAGTPGLIGWHELMAGDLASAWGFYADLFGWSKGEAINMGPMGIYQLFATGGDAVGGMMSKPAEVPAPGWLYYFNVAGIDAALGRITAGGGQVLMGPQQVPGGSWIVQALDPQGAAFAVVSMVR